MYVSCCVIFIFVKGVLVFILNYNLLCLFIMMMVVKRFLILLFGFCRVCNFVSFCLLRFFNIFLVLDMIVVVLNIVCLCVIWYLGKVWE